MATPGDEESKWPDQVMPIIRPAYRPAPPHVGHKNHLCDMAERGEVTLEQMKALVRDPRYICKKCGRVAHNEENLCEPVPLLPIAPPVAQTPQRSQ